MSADGRALAPQWSAVKVLAGRQSLKLPFRLALDGRPGRVAVSADLFPYDPRHQTFVNIYEGDELTQAILDRGRTAFEYFAGTRRGSFAAVQKFLPAGIHHILIGPDHVLFLVGLLLLGGTIRRLALIVTAFTVAHSITLSLAALEPRHPARAHHRAGHRPQHHLRGRGQPAGQDAPGRATCGAWIAFAFGFIHGFGFANVLREMDLPARALGWSLFAFNLGVEVGQLLVVAVVATALAALRSRNEAAGRQLALAGSVAVMAAGAFWFIAAGLLSWRDVMRRGMVLGMLLALGALAVRRAQSPSPSAPKVIEVEKVKDNLWVLRGGGGNTAVFVTASGVVVVDAKNPGWGQPVLDKIKTLTDKPVTTLINTHTHGDHVSGNVAFPARSRS